MSDRLTPIVRLAPAKLNLTLAVLGRRPDGYHDLHSVMVPLGLSDRLSLASAAAATDTIHVRGFETAPAEDDLVLRAIAEARDTVRRTLGPSSLTPPLAVRLEKRIPVAAGLAGGSSDAAAALDGALEAWSAALEPEQRLAAVARIGSDVPFFLAGGAALVEGRGERVTRLGAVTGGPPAVLLVTPGIALHTRAAFAAFDTDPAAAPSDPRSTRASSEHLAIELRGGLRTTDLVARAGVLASANDLTAAAFVVVPGLLALRRGLVRLLARPIGLSGSGPTLWALYPSLDDARIAAETVTRAIAEGGLVAPGDRPPSVIATTIDTPPARDTP